MKVWIAVLDGDDVQATITAISEDILLRELALDLDRTLDQEEGTSAANLQLLILGYAEADTTLTVHEDEVISE